MNGLTRSLHPQIEAAQYVPLDFWTFFPDANPRRPQIARASLPDHSGLNEPATVKVSRRRGPPSVEEVYAWLTREPQTVKQAAGALGISYASASNFLWRLAQRGRAVRSYQAAGYRRPAVVRYARAK